jgi:alkaline phosphatase D
VRRGVDHRRAPGSRAGHHHARRARRGGVPFGVSTGDVADDRAIVWSVRSSGAADRRCSTTPSFTDTRRIIGPAALEETDFTRPSICPGLPANGAFRIACCSRISPSSDASACRLKAASRRSGSVAPRRPGSAAPTDRDVTFAFSADSVGQGWGIDPARGGMRLCDAMRRAPDVFIHLGDTIYADQPVQAESRARRRVDLAQRRDRGEIRRSRRNWRIFAATISTNRQDEHMRRFSAEVCQWCCGTTMRCTTTEIARRSASTATSGFA